MTPPVETPAGEGLKVGAWVLFRDNSEYRPIEVRMKQATKVTGKTVYFDSQWPKQTSILNVVASFEDQTVATSVLERINGGVSGEYEQRRRSAEDERSRRITEALVSAQARVRVIISQARGAA